MTENRLTRDEQKLIELARESIAETFDFPRRIKARKLIDVLSKAIFLTGDQTFLLAMMFSDGADTSKFRETNWELEQIRKLQKRRILKKYPKSKLLADTLKHI